jgi:hypothetical protein
VGKIELHRPSARLVLPVAREPLLQPKRHANGSWDRCISRGKEHGLSGFFFEASCSCNPAKGAWEASAALDGPEKVPHGRRDLRAGYLAERPTLTHVVATGD